MVSARGRPLISSPHFAFFILAFIAAAHGIRHAHGSNQCHIGCHGSGGGIGFEDGQRYEYKYEGSSKMRVGGSSQDLAQLGVTATVSITPITSCTFHLELTNIQIDGNKKGLNSESITKGTSGILAGIDSTGRLMGQICAPQDQSIELTNLHRAVVSLLQTHIPKHAQPSLNSTLHQTDVFGVCSTEYSIKGKGDEVSVSSSRDLDSCAHREEARLPLITSPYHSKSGFEKTRVLEGTQKREQKFVNRILQETSSEELYNSAQLSDQSAASVTVNSKLTLVTKAKAGTPPVTEIFYGKSIIFEVVDDETKSATFDEIKTGLIKLSEGSVTVIQETNPRDFNKFVKKIAGSNKSDIMKLLNLIKEGQEFKNKLNARRILLDGLVESASSPAVEVMSALLKSGEVTGVQARMWLLSFPNTKKVSKEALLAAKEVLESGTAPVQAYLGIGALVGKYCIQENCQSSEIVNSIQEIMAKPLFETCKPSNFIIENNILAGLKGLGNIRVLGEKVAKRLSECALNKEAWMRVRVAILETMKTNSKNPIVIETSEKILKDLEEDSELRIKAYLSLVENPSSQVADIIRDVLINEQSNQVGGFIVSHLRNVRSSTNPDKEAARHHLGGIYTRSGKFGWDPKKYSQNYELSYNDENWGAAGEANLIYSQEGYLPRSLGFNLTTSLYGHSFNLFEFGMRTENAEKVYENLLKSLVMKREVVNDLIKNGTDVVDDFANRFSHSLRPKRSVEIDQVNQFYQKMEKKPKVYHDQLLVDFSVKSLGAEVGFFSHLGDDIGPHKSMDQFFSGLQYSIDKAKNLNVEYSKHSTFLEGEIIYPTGLGLPLKVITKGSAAFGLIAQAKMDIPSAVQDHHKTHHMKMKLIPSGTVDVVGSLLMDAGNFETGVEVTLTAHSSTGGEVSLKLTKGKELEIILGVPLREQKIISATTELNTVIRTNKDVTTVPVDLDINKVSIEEYSGCFEQLSPLTGLTFCGDLSMPNNNKPTLNPFYGPSKISFSVHVEDESITSYLFRSSYEHMADKNKRKFILLLDTPGSKVNRKISFGYETEINPEIKSLKFYMDSFWKSMSVHGSLLESEKEVSVNGKVRYEDNEYITKAGLTRSNSSPTVTVYTPFFQYSFPQHNPRLVGRQKSSAPTIKLSGEVLVERKEGATTYLFNRLTVETHRSNYTLDGSISSQHKGESSTINTDLKIIYDEEYISINGTLSRPDRTRLEGNLIVFPSQNPSLAFSTRSRLESVMNQDYKFLAEFDFTHGPNPDNKELRFSFVNDVLVSGIRESNIKYVAIRHHVSYPPTSLKFISDLEWLPRNLKYKMDAKLDQSSADFKLTVSTDPAGPYDIYLAAMIMDKGFKLDAKREVIENYKSKFTNSLEIVPGKFYEVNALVNHKYIWSDLDLAIQSEIKTPLEPKHIRISTGVQNNDEKILAQFFFEADTKIYVDFFTERIKGPKSKGNFKLLLTDYIDSKGDFGYQDSVLKGSGYMTFVKSQNKVEASIDALIKYPKYGGTIDATWTDASRKTQKYKLITETNLDTGVFDTKNTFTYDEMDNQFNLKLKRTGNKQKGTTNMDLEVKLGKGDHVTSKYSRNLNAVPGDAEGEYNMEITHRASAKANPTKIIVKLVGKHIDFDQGKIDGQLSLSYTNPEGKDVAVQLAHKKMPKDDKWIVNCLLDASGSLMDSPVNLKLESEVSRSLFADSISWSRFLPPSSYRITASFGTDSSFESFGKMAGNALSSEILFKLPQGYKLSSFKWTTINLVQLHPGPENKRQIKSSNVFKWNNKFFEVDSEFVLEKEGGSIQFDWETDTSKKRSFHITSHWPKSSEDVIDFDISFKYDKEGKPSDAFLKYQANPTKGEGILHFHGTCPAKGVYDLKIATKRFSEGKGLHTEWVLVSNNKTRKGLYKILRVANHPYIEFYMEDEDHAKSGFLIKADKKGLADWTGNVHVEWAMEPGKKGFFYVNSEMTLKSFDNFLIKVEANSNKYQIKDWQVEVKSDTTQTSGSRKVAFKMQHDSKTIFSGTGTYDLNYVNDGVYKIEAKGEAMVSGSLEPISLKAIWKPSAPRKGFNGSLVHGENVLTVESIIDESEIYYVRKYCSPKLEKKCSEAKIIWNSAVLGEEQEEKKLDVVLDFSSMNPAFNDVKVKANLKKDKRNIDHNIEFQWFKDRIISYKAYLNEDKAGLTIGLPKRTISGDIVFQVPCDINQGRLYIEANLWMNKLKEPEKKTYLLISGELARDKDLYAFTSEAKLTHPSLPKNFVIKGKANVGESWSKPKSEGHFKFDVFKRIEDLVTITWNLGNNDEKGSYSSYTSLNAKSKGLKIDLGYDRRVTMSKTSVSWIDTVYYVDQNGAKKEASIKADIKPKKFLLSLKLPDVPMYDINYSLEKKDKKITLFGNYEFAGTKYKETVQINNLNTVNYQFQFGKGKTLFVDFGLAFGQMVEFKASMNKNPIYEMEISLNEGDFLKTRSNYNNDNYKKLFETIGEEMTIITNNYDKEIKRAVDRDGKELGQLVKRFGSSIADPTPLLKSYQHDLDNTLEEILEDEAFQQILIPLRTLLSSGVEKCVEFFEELIKLTTEMRVFFQQSADYAESIIASIAAKIKETSNSVSSSVSKMIESLLVTYLDFVDAVYNEYNKHSKEIQDVCNTLSEFSQDMGRLIVSFGKQAKKELDNFLRESWEEVKHAPLIQLLEEKLKELKNYKVSEGYWPDIQEILRMLADAAPNPELRRFINTLTNYIDQYFKEDNLDLDLAVREIYHEFIASIKPTMDSIYDALSHEESLFNSKFWVPMPWLSLWKAGESSSGGIRLSTVRWILSGDLPSLVDYSLHAWKSLGHILPPYKARAYILSGEMITYDGRELSLKEGIYVLAQDIDNRFSVVAELEDGLLKSVHLIKGSDNLYVTPDGKTWLNGKELGHSTKSKDNKPGATLNIPGTRMETDEVKVVCYSELVICRVTLKIPAFAKVRGLLGTYNYEYYDEFTLPNGTVTTNEEEFINSWKLGGNEEEKKSHIHNHQHRCTQLFFNSNQLMFCYRLVNPKPFREACDHAVEKAKTPESKMEALCNTAHQYVKACRANNLRVDIPSPCDVCKVDGKEVTKDEFKLFPKQEDKADIVFIVELKSDNSKLYESLVRPVQQKLSEQLKLVGIRDIEFSLIGFGTKDFPYINFFKKNGKLQIKDDLPMELPWDNSPGSQSIQTNSTLLDKFWQMLDQFYIADDETSRGIARSEVVKSYPWRAGSYRSIVSLVSTPCPQTEPILSPLTRIKMAQRLMTMKSSGIVYNLITPVRRLRLPAGKTADVLGFTKDEVYMINDVESGKTAKERKQGMSYYYDSCHLFPLETGGNVFVSENLKSNTETVTSISKRIASSLLSNTKSYQCQCVMNRGLYPKYECNVQNP